jgi:hypothetical protein
MKTVYSILVALLFIFFTQASCENDNGNSDSHGIVGKWEVINVPEDCQGGFGKLEITSNNVFRGFYQDTLYFKSSFQLKKTEKHDTLYFSNDNDYQKYALINLIDDDTLKFIPPILTITPTCITYKRIK